MDFQTLCELADREIRAGIADSALMQRAMGEANGVEAHAHQIYWRLRATALQQDYAAMPPSERDARLRDLAARITAEEKRRTRRIERRGSAWVFLCYGSLAAGFIFIVAAVGSVRKRPASALRYGAIGLVATAVGVTAYVRYHRVAAIDLPLI